MPNRTESAKTTPKIMNTANLSPFSKLLFKSIKKIGPIAKLNRKPTGKPNKNAVVEILFIQLQITNYDLRIENYKLWISLSVICNS